MCWKSIESRQDNLEFDAAQGGADQTQDSPLKAYWEVKGNKRLSASCSSNFDNWTTANYEFVNVELTSYL